MGAWFVDLAPVTDEALIPRVALSELGAREVPGQTASVTLTDYFRARSLLLVLDNCEHVVVACAALSDALLRACPGVRVVVTSREPLGLVGEATWRVPSLGLPPPQAGDTVIVRSEAVRLFVERARLVQPGFEVTTTNAAALAQLCRDLDGIPLALFAARSASASKVAAMLCRPSLVNWPLRTLPSVSGNAVCRGALVNRGLIQRPPARVDRRPDQRGPVARPSRACPRRDA
jgi:predicted ATPase